MKRLLIIFLCLIMSVLIFSGCSKNVYPITTTQLMMDTVISITIYDGDSKVIDGAVELCRKYENILSRTIEGSDIYRINHSNGEPVTVEKETADLLKYALDISRNSNGAFDPTILPLVELWDVANATSVPDKEKIATAKVNIDYHNIEVKSTTVTAKNNAQVDLGGIAKGYIADKVYEYLASNGVTSAVINLGGNTALLGNKHGEDFSVGIQKPFAKNGVLSAILMLDDKTAVTSGIYQRYFEADGKIYHHILDTKTGYPIDNKISSVTVITDSSTIADGLSTACLALGIEKGTALAKHYDAELIFITSDGEITLTEGLIAETNETSTIIKLK